MDSQKFTDNLLSHFLIICEKTNLNRLHKNVFLMLGNMTKDGISTKIDLTKS